MSSDGDAPTAAPVATDAPICTKRPDFQPVPAVPDAPVSQKRKCSYISGTGAGCRAYALKDSPEGRCFYHSTDPIAIAKRERGLRDKNKRSTAQQDGLAGWETRPLDTLEAVRDALSELFNEGARGTITASRLSALSAISNSISKAIEGSDLEARIAALEEKVQAAKK
jgi:hypothetical protein